MRHEDLLNDPANAPRVRYFADALLGRARGAGTDVPSREPQREELVVLGSISL